jgi:hypothetical protein
VIASDLSVGLAVIQPVNWKESLKRCQPTYSAYLNTIDNHFRTHALDDRDTLFEDLQIQHLGSKYASSTRFQIIIRGRADEKMANELTRELRNHNLPSTDIAKLCKCVLLLCVRRASDQKSCVY